MHPSHRCPVGFGSLLQGLPDIERRTAQMKDIEVNSMRGSPVIRCGLMPEPKNLCGNLVLAVKLPP